MSEESPKVGKSESPEEKKNAEAGMPNAEVRKRGRKPKVESPKSEEDTDSELDLIDGLNDFEQDFFRLRCS